MTRPAIRRRLYLCYAIALASVIMVTVMLAVDTVTDRQAVAEEVEEVEEVVSTPTFPDEPPVSEEPPLAGNPYPPAHAEIDLMRQTAEVAQTKSVGCLHCHKGIEEPHSKTTVNLGCTDCHGGDASTTDYVQAHVHPRFPEAWRTSANPQRSYTLLNNESPDFIRFVNPGDLRVAHVACGTLNCHPKETLQVRKSMMTNGCMLWGAALYNNGAYPNKRARFGEAYSTHGEALRIQTVPPPTDEEIVKKGVVPFLDPLAHFEVSQPGNILRIFERGGRFQPEVGIPERREETGRPRTRLSTRGLGTLNRTDPVWVSLNKTRLLDPTLNFLGTNDHPGDYRSSGCTACHVIYANDRSPVNSGPYAWAGHLGHSYSPDPTIPKNQSGHPIRHKFTLSIPSSQCIVCHMHPGTTVLNSYLGFMWWDLETNGEFMYPEKQRYPTAEEAARMRMSNPNECSMQGLWSDPEFLERVYELNPKLDKTQFADFHGHGWVYRAVFKKRRDGVLLDYENNPIEDVTPEVLQAAMAPATPEERVHGKQRSGIPVHFMDVHLEKGMHCIDCHFSQDVHGDTKLYGEVRAAIEITCRDCHGTVSKRPTLLTSGPAAAEGGRNLAALRTPFGKPRFEWRGKKLIQHSMVEKGTSWEISQVKDTVDPKSENYNERAHLAKTVRMNGQGQMVWGKLGANEAECAHSNDMVSCASCHSSWNPSCFGCHLPQKANLKMPHLHNKGDVTRNYTAYNFQTLRDDVYMLAKDGTATGNRVSPARSACAIFVSSYNAKREGIYNQQQTISADGMSGIAFSTNSPHTVRGKDGTKRCTDCHLSENDDNNAIMAQLLMHGTGWVNFIGKYCWVGCGDHGLFAVQVTEQKEPQAVIGSRLQSLAFPDYYKKHLEHHGELQYYHEHPGKDIAQNITNPFRKVEVKQVQQRGEYVYAACGKGGFRVFDIAFIEDKAFSERITSAPVSPLGQRLYVKTKYCTGFATPATLAPDPTRKQNPDNEESPVAALYAYLYVIDKYEGLIMVGAGTLLDGNPVNNFLKRACTFNPDGILNGARTISIIGTYAYIGCDAGLVVVDLQDPLKPCVTAVLGEGLVKPRAIKAQFRYAYVCDEEGVKVLDITEPAHPFLVNALEMHDARNIYLARTYAYVAAGHEGIVILNIERADVPVIDQVYNADGYLCDVNDIQLGSTYVSLYAYVADGKKGLAVLELVGAESKGHYGFSPRPEPKLIAKFKIPGGGHAYSISRGVDRDRAVDESGNQIAVFGRVGARPFNLEEQRKLYMWKGVPWRVSDEPGSPLYQFLEDEPEPGDLEE
ncbi:LVIVD repeat protein [Planctomycetes bacterium Pan216]|uniref:LVIVD repeat protein n=1 Tax=Kolteria novifilia TaxID=2527975 RepID=A0A518B7S7_9BACT|nr:LVIVD repeat protein [Planctomycetes bacterium Pan216]